jgi:menaquinone-dependent protoporphyrinogen oxidase
MKPILVLYATREGQTRKIADHVAESLRAKGLLAEVRNAAEIREPFNVESFGASVIAASVHGGHHEREITTFVQKHREALAQMPSAFLSVSLSEAGAEDLNASAEKRAQASAAAQQMLDSFLHETGFRPNIAKPIAGALVYSKYGPIVRLVMKRIAKSMGGPTDVSRDYEYTHWPTLDHYMGEFVASLDARPEPS